MKRIVCLVVAAMCFGTASCNHVPVCGAIPPKPERIRSPRFFGRVTADPRGWIFASNGSSRALIVVGGKSLATDPSTERLGYCGSPSDPTRCAAFVGLRRPGVAAWILLATPSSSTTTEKGRFEIADVMVWKVRTSSVVLSQGVELRFGRTFANTLKRSDALGYGLRRSLEGRQVAMRLYVDPRSGEVLDAVGGGCA